MATIDIQLAVLHPGQQQIKDSPARYRVVCCGRRFGKTALAIDEMVDAALDGLRVAYFTPTHSNGREVWRKAMQVLKPVIRTKNEVERRIELVTGGVIEFWSAEGQDSILGRAYHLVLIDEAAIIPDGDLWQMVIRPMLTDYKGRALFTSSPRGLNWFWELWARGQDDAQDQWASWQFPTVANPFIDPAEVEEARRGLPEKFFSQEYLAAFVEDAGMVFRGVDGVSTLSPAQPQPGGEYVFGVDWARTFDFTVISVFDVKHKRQVALERFNQISWSLQRGRLAALAALWKPRLILAEENSIGGPNIEALQNEGLPVQPFSTTAATKAPLIEGFALAIERGDVTLLDNPVQRLELKSYMMERLPSGNYRYNAPRGGHDDCVIAAALGWKAVIDVPPIMRSRANPIY